MDLKEQILAALKKLGPSSPSVIADNIGADPGRVGYYARQMIEAKAIKAAGTSGDRVYALPDQKIEGVRAAPPQNGKKPRKSGKPQAAKPARKGAAAPNDSFLPAFTADQRLVLVQDGQSAQVFSVERTSAIADLLLNHFEV